MKIQVRFLLRSESFPYLLWSGLHPLSFLIAGVNFYTIVYALNCISLTLAFKTRSLPFKEDTRIQDRTAQGPMVEES